MKAGIGWTRGSQQQNSAAFLQGVEQRRLELVLLIIIHSAHPFGNTNGGGGGDIANRLSSSSSSSFPASILLESRNLSIFLLSFSFRIRIRTIEGSSFLRLGRGESEFDHNMFPYVNFRNTSLWIVIFLIFQALTSTTITLVHSKTDGPDGILSLSPCMHRAHTLCLMSQFLISS